MPLYYKEKRMDSPRSRIRYSRLIVISVGISIITRQEIYGFTSSHIKRKLPTTCSSSSLHVIEKQKPRFNFFGSRANTNDHTIDNEDEHKSRQQSRHRAKKTMFKKNIPEVEQNGAMEEMPKIMKNRTDFEMAVMSTLAITIPTGVIVTLAMSGESSESMTEQIGNFGRDIGSLFSVDSPTDGVVTVAVEGLELIEDSFDQISEISFNVFDAAVPTTATDVISVALGEGIAAGIGGLITSLAGIGLKTQGLLKSGFSVFDNSNNSTGTGTGISSKTSVDGFIAGAVADTDYFITRAGLSALGVPSFLGVILAAVPSQLIKLSARQREQRQKEALFMDNLLVVEQNRKKGFSLSSFSLRPKKVEDPTFDDLIEQRPAEVTPGLANQVDFVEIFQDITKWLEYDVLIQNFDGTVTLQGVPVSSGVTSAVFGFLAALSSQLWADVIYRNFDYGLESNREAAKARSLDDTLTLYSLRCLSAATLFGVYESVRLPISTLIVGLLSGGVDSCVGSQDYNLCIETFVVDNPAQATSEGEARAFLVAAVNILERLNDFSSSSSMNVDDLPELIRSLAVQLASMLH